MNILRFKKEIILLLLLIAIGALLRFYNLNWDQGHYFHPDERNVANAVGRIRFFSQLDPQFFAYGGFSIYLYRAAGEILSLLTHNSNWVADWGQINQLGRFFSALFSTLTIIPLFFLTKKIFTRRAAILAVLFYTFGVAFIQVSHYDTTESLLTFFAVSITLFSLQMLENPTRNNYFKCALLVGVATATKTTSLIFIIVPFLAYLLTLVQKKQYIKHTSWLFLFLGTALLTFTIFSPYTFLSWNKFQESMNYESGVVTGKLPVVYTYQFIKTSPYLFQLSNLPWQLGPIAFISLLGLFALIITAIIKRSGKLLLLLSLPIVYFLYIGSWHTKFLRYMIPILPFFIIFTSYILDKLLKSLESDQLFSRLKLAVLGKIVIGILLVLTLLWAWSFFSIYTREQTRISASKWIFQNIPPESKLLGEEWDDGLPLPLTNGNPSIFQIEPMRIYEPDNASKLTYYANKLSSGDYIVINSRRLYGTLINLPEKYPLTSKYYRMLFAGQLGYQKVAQFTSYPSLLGYEINDDSSEETFQVYDHPKVIIFQNVGRFTAENYQSLLSPGLNF